MECYDELDEIKGQNALYQNEISLLNANLVNLAQEQKEKVDSMKNKLQIKENEIDTANDGLNELNSKLNRKLDEISDLKSKILSLEYDVKLSRELNEQQEKDSSVKLYKKKFKKTNA